MPNDVFPKKKNKDLRSDFGPDSYNLIRKNCNHFANALVWALLGRTIPPHVNRLADIGTCLSCCLPKQLLQAAPVGPNNNSTDGYKVFGGRNNNNTTAKTKVAPFSGTGSKLSTSSSDNRNGLMATIIGGTKPNDDTITDRREKARIAALVRLDKQRQGA